MQLCSALAANYAAADLETLKDTIENAKVRVKLKASLSEKVQMLEPWSRQNQLRVSCKVSCA